MKTILVIDDDPSTRKILESLLTSKGYKVVTATDGKETLPKVHSHNPDLIIMDLIMPQMGGSEAVRQLRKDLSTQHIPVLFLTSVNSTNEYDNTSFDIQVDNWIYATMNKPFDSEKLLAAITDLLAGKEQTK